jgi:PAS domain S-box-containing protein
MDVKVLQTLKGENTTWGTGYPNQSVTEVIPNGFFTVDRKWTVKYWNRAAEKLIGIQSTDIIGKNLWDGFSNHIPSEFSKVFNHSFLKETPIHFEEYLGKMGNWFDVVIYHCDNNVSVSFKSSLGPTKKKDLQQQLVVLNELYRFVTEVTNDCLWEWDLHAKEIFWIDGGHKRILGYQIENALIPQSFWEDRIHPDDQAKVFGHLEDLKMGKSGGVWEVEYRFRRLDGEYVFMKDKGKVLYDQEPGAVRIVGTSQDITDKKSIEGQLVQERLIRQKAISYAVLTAQEKERADIGREMQDDLNQILVAAKLYIEMAKTDEFRKVDYLEKSSLYLMNVIEEIRTISKKLRMPGMSMSLFDSIRFTIDKINIIHPVKLEFHSNNVLEDDLDETLQLDIFRIIQELVSNITKHAMASNANIQLIRIANDVTLIVSDNGQGCDLLKTKMGTGIINILSHAELYASRISTNSSPGNGYEFKIVLPISGRMRIPLHTLSDYDD